MALENTARACSTCGWTALQLRDTGRMGCGDCYAAFEAMVEQAVSHLHASAGAQRAPFTPAASPSTSPSTHEDLPWPTRRAQRSR